MDRFKKELLELRHYYRHNISKNDITCQKCWLPVWDLDFHYIINHLLRNNRPIKKL